MAEIMCGQMTPRPSIVIKTPLKSQSMYLLHSPLSFNTPRFAIAIGCTATSTPLTKPQKNFVSTQRLFDKYGLTEESITKALTICNGRLQSTSTKNVEQVLKLLEDYRLSPHQIRRTIGYNPNLLTLNAMNNLKPKLEFLKIFMKDKEIAKLVSTNSRSLQLSLEPRLKSAVLFLQKCGFEGEALARILCLAPYLLTTSEDKALRLFKRVEDIGLTKRSKMFPYALGAICGMKKDLLERKLQHLCGLGFSEEEVRVICKRHPAVLATSMDKLKRSVDFLVNSAGVSLSEIVRYPALLMYSVETRIIPRYRVVKAVQSMTEVKRMPNFPKIVKMTEKCFLDKFVDAFSAEAPFLYDIYRGVSDSEGIGEIEKDSQLPHDFSQVSLSKYCFVSSVKTELGATDLSHA